MNRTSIARGDCDGFTLIELLIVIVVLGILAAVVVFATGGASESAKTSACEVERRIVITAVEAYEAEYRVAPTMTELVNARLLASASLNYDVDGSPLPSGQC